MADAKQKWQDATRQILLALDIAAEYTALGVQLSGKKPNAKGWIYCHSVDVDADHSPSAGVNVIDGPFLGRYKDFRSGRSCTLFDFAAERGRFAGNWKEARNHFARQTGVKLPDGEEELTSDRFEFFDLTFGVMQQYAAGKQGVTVRALQDVGTRGARWPKGLAAEKTNHLFVVPMYGSALLDLEPTGWHCVAANPRAKVRKFQGKGNEDALLKTMTAGEYGLMNVDALNRLAEADVVNIVEGISDLFACQAALTVWRDEDSTGRKHVVLSAGACTYHPKAEWMQHFAGKDVRIWFDVGDGNNEGQIGAAVWVSALLPVAKTVRNVQLPLGKDGGKNDLRAWLNEGPRTYVDMIAYGETFQPIEAGDQSAQLSAGDALLKNLGLVVIGEHEGSQKIEVYSEHAKKSGTITDIDKLSVAKLIQFLGADVVEEYVHDGKEPMPGKAQLRDVRNAIAAAASDKLFHSDEKLGVGIWEAENQVILVKAREAAFMNGTGKLNRSFVPFFAGRILDLGQSVGDWYDFGALSRHVASAQQPTWCVDVFEEAYNLFSKWYWRHRSTPKVVASLVICSWLQTLWEWRPEVFITGGSDTGKSLLMEDVVNRGIFGALAMYVQKPTEAAIRQHMKHHAKLLLVDEFEHDAHRQKILELCRTSSRGGDTIRGTADQRGAKYRLRHIPWFAAIETGLRKQADRNRYIILELNEIPPDQRGRIELPTTERLRDLGMRLLAVGLRYFRAAKNLAVFLKGQRHENVPGRVVESFSVPSSMFSAIYQHNEEAADGFMRNMMAEWDFGDQSTRDDVDLLQEIFTSEVQIEGGQRATVSQLLAKPGDADYVAALQRVGIRRIKKRNRDGQVVLWLCTNVIRKNLLRNAGDFGQQSIEQYLMRLKGAARSKQHLGGEQSFTGVEVPQDTIDESFALMSGGIEMPEESDTAGGF